jgi:hypothetical protein
MQIPCASIDPPDCPRQRPIDAAMVAIDATLTSMTTILTDTRHGSL